MGILNSMWNNYSRSFRGFQWSEQFEAAWQRWRRRCFFSIDEPTLDESEEHYDHICHNILWERNETVLLAKEKAQILERFIP